MKLKRKQIKKDFRDVGIGLAAVIIVASIFILPYYFFGDRGFGFILFLWWIWIIYDKRDWIKNKFGRWVEFNKEKE